jgi:hypothetical protein
MLVTASLACLIETATNPFGGESRKRVQEIIADNLSKAGWNWAASQRLIPAGEQSGLQTRIAVTVSGSLCTPMKS